MQRSSWVSSLRRLAAAPVFALGVVLCLAMGLGVLAGMAAVTDAFLLRPLPFAAPERLVWIWKAFDDEPSAGLQFFLAPDDFLFLRDEVLQLEVAAVKSVDVDVTGDGEPVRVAAAWSTAELAQVLGLRGLRGRFFSAEDERTGHAVAVISTSWWRRKWAGDEAVLGASLTVEGRPYTIIGIWDDTTAFPDGVDLWLPMREADWQARQGLGVIGRLGGTATAGSALQEVREIGRRLRELRPDANATAGLELELLQRNLVGELRPSLQLLLIAAAVFLFIAVANSASLVVARALRGRPDMAVRMALGAGRGALVRQIACDVVLLVTVAVVLGLAAAAGLLRVLLTASPVSALSFAPVGIDVRIGFAAAGLGMLIAAALTAVYAVVGLRGVASTPAVETRRARSPRRRLLVALVVADLTMTVLLLLASWHVGWHVSRMLGAQTGVRQAGLVAAGVSASNAWAETQAQRVAFVDRVLSEVGGLPGVTSVAAVHALPMTQPEYYWSFRMADRPAEDADARDIVLFRVIVGDYFATLGMKILDGRPLEPADVDGSRRVVWVNEAFAERYGEGESMLERPLVSTRGGDPRYVVGVVSDVRERGLAEPVPPCIYWPMAQYDRRYLSRMHLVVRAEARFGALAASLRPRLDAIDPASVVFDVRAFDEVVFAAVQRERFARLLLGVFALLAALQAAAGIYGLTSYDVASRRRELGLRQALGATHGGLVRSVLGDGLRQALAGFALGSLAAYLASDALDAIWSVGRVAPTTYALVAAILSGMVVVAALPAAARATRVDPAVVLREE